ncbi:MAG: hypothetical protein HOP19_14835 [Acidobacteria bacterium]|nr:hypothetical protein [Acidobacteriota bacterium]
MINEFKAWFRMNEQRLKNGLIQVEIEQRDDPTEVIKAVLENEMHIASIIHWEIGALDVDVLSLSEGKSIFARRYDLENPNEITLVLEEVASKFLHRSFD